MARLRSRVGFAIVGTIILAGAGAVVGARSVLPGDQVAAAAITTSQESTTTDSSQLDQTAATATVASPTETPAQQATSTPRAQPTARPTVTPGGIVTLSCTIDTVDSSAGTFTCHNSIVGTKTVVTNEQTVFTGAATQFSGLRAGLRARNTGIYQTDGTFVATRVSSSVDR